MSSTNVRFKNWLRRQLEPGTKDPMVRQVVMTHLNAQAIVDDAVDPEENAATQLTFADVGTQIAGDPKGRNFADFTNNEWDLVPGKWLVEVVLHTVNSAATAGAIKAFLTDQGTTSVVIYGQPAEAWVTQPLAGNVRETAMIAFVADIPLPTDAQGNNLSAASLTSVELRVANIGAAGANLTIDNGSYVIFTKIANAKDA